MEGPGRTRGVAAGARLDQVRQGGTKTRAGSNERARRAGDRRRSNRTKILSADVGWKQRNARQINVRNAK